MNAVSLIGNLVRDPDIRTTNSGKMVTNFTLAVNRRFKSEGQADADFISCVLWGAGAETFVKYCQKGSKVGITGRIQTRGYEDKDGNSRTSTEIVVDGFDFLSSANTNRENVRHQDDPKNFESDNEPMPWE